MWKKILLLVILCFPVALFAQEQKFMIPDYASIRQMTSDPNSLFYYPNLIKKYKANDTTLSLREYRMLYYGYTFQVGYEREPKNTVEDDSIKMIFAKGMLTQDDLAEVVRLGKAYLEKVPFDMKRLNLVYVAANEIGDEATAKIYLDKVRKLALTILTTGDGLTQETAFHIISVPDESAVITILGYKPNGFQNMATTRYLTLEENADNLKGLYFDLDHHIQGYTVK